MSGAVTENTRPEEHLPALVETTNTPATPPDDPDDRAVAAALAEVEADEPQQAQQPATPSPAPARPAQGQSPAAQQPQVMIPKARFDEVARRARTFEEENLYLKGALAAHQATAQAGGQQGVASPPTQAAQPSIQDQIAAQAARIIDASKQFDAGDLSMADLKTIELDANDRITQLRTTHLLRHIETTVPREAPIGLLDQQALAEHVEQMAADHPWSALLNDGELGWLAARARDEAQGLGRPFGTGPAETLRLRQMVAELADFYGPRWYPNYQPPAAVAQSQAASTRPTLPGATASQQPRRDVAAAQAKVALAARQPPNTATAGSAGSAAEMVTEDKIASMTEDEILALPPAIRDRYLNG